MCQIDRESVAVEVLRDIALDDSRMLAERQRAIDALTLFPSSAVMTLEYIARKTDLEVLRERSRLYIQRIKSGAYLSLSGV
ncbi:MAG TPA: hypothetical protein PK600_08355 [Deltaproteobacteria bacterium]|nr:hypothetical protein [Deltaproteobacteria bacterium]